MTTTLTHSAAPHHTIWGSVDHITACPLAPIWHVVTPGHGGYVVDRQWALDNLPQEAIAVGTGRYGAQTPNSPHIYFEEDCNWAVLELYVSEDIARWCFDTIHNWQGNKEYWQHRQDVEKCVQAYTPDAYNHDKLTGHSIAPQDFETSRLNTADDILSITLRTLNDMLRHSHLSEGDRERLEYLTTLQSNWFKTATKETQNNAS